MGPTDKISPSWTLTPITDRLQRRLQSRQALEFERFGNGSPRQTVSQAASIVPDRASDGRTPQTLTNATAEEAAGVKETYWIMTDPRTSKLSPNKSGGGDNKGWLSTQGDDSTPSPPLEPPPSRLLSRGPLFPDAGAPSRAKRRSRGLAGKGRSKSGTESMGPSTDTTAPPPLPLQESPSSRQSMQRTPAAMFGSFFVRKHHASRNGTGRRILTIRRGAIEAAGGQLSTVIALKKLRGGSSSGSAGVDGERPLLRPRGTSSSSNRTAENGTGECRVGIAADDKLEVLSGGLAFSSGSIHQSKVHRPDCCLVLRCNGLLVAAVEMESEDEVRLAKAILSASQL